MEVKPFEASVRSQPGFAVIDLYGEIDTFAEEALNRAYQQASSQRPNTILLNFKGVDYINSKGIALIVGLLSQAQKEGCRLFVYGLSQHYVEIFNITRLSDFMNIYPDEVSALAGVA